MNLQEALIAIDGRKEFIQKKLNGNIIINYLISLPDSFDGIRKEFRGIVFNEQTGEVVSWPLHKFFNVNQKDETQFHVLGDQSCLRYEKLDGTLCHALEINGKIVLATRMGWETDWAIAATKKLRSMPLNAQKEVEEGVKSGWTVMFEYIGPNNPIVVPYEKEELVYLWSRNRNSGEYKHKGFHGFRHPVVNISTLGEVMKEVETLENAEGYVCVLENGMWVKIKCPWYCNLHGAYDVLMKPAYFLYEIALNNEMDDLIAKCQDKFKPKLQEIEKRVAEDKITLLEHIKTKYDEYMRSVISTDERQRRKEFALTAGTEPRIFSVLMDMYLKKDIERKFNALLQQEYQAKYKGRLFEVLEES